jgi:hypothetical protein
MGWISSGIYINCLVHLAFLLFIPSSNEVFHLILAMDIFVVSADTDLIIYICEENKKDRVVLFIEYNISRLLV